MPNPSAVPLPDPLARAEQDWKARRKVESAFHVFYMGGTPESAQALAEAVQDWQVATGAMRAKPAAIAEIDAALEASAVAIVEATAGEAAERAAAMRALKSDQ